MILHSRTKTLMALGGLFAIAAIAIAVLVVSGSSDAASEPTTSERFGVLRPADAEAMEAVPAEARAQFAALAESELPGNEGPAKISEVGVASLSGGSEFAVAAFGEAVCAVHASDVACDAADQAGAGKLFGARPRACGTYWVFGVVPDGVTRILIDSGEDGSMDRTLTVNSNVYEGELRGVKSRAEGVNEAGDTVLSVSLPLDYYAQTNEGC